MALQQVERENQEAAADSLRAGADGIKDLKLTDAADQAGAVLLSRAATASTSSTQTAEPLRYRLPWAIEASSGVQHPSDAVATASPEGKRQRPCNGSSAGRHSFCEEQQRGAGAEPLFPLRTSRS